MSSFPTQNGPDEQIAATCPDCGGSPDSPQIIEVEGDRMTLPGGETCSNPTHDQAAAQTDDSNPRPGETASEWAKRLSDEARSTRVPRFHTGSCAKTQSELRPLDPRVLCDCGADEWNEGVAATRLLGFALFNLSKGNTAAAETLTRKAYVALTGEEWDAEPHVPDPIVEPYYRCTCNLARSSRPQRSGTHISSGACSQQEVDEEPYIDDLPPEAWEGQ